MNHVAKLQALLASSEAEAMLLTSEVSQRYAVGFHFSDGFVLLLQDKTYLITDFRYREEAMREVDGSITVITPTVAIDFIRDTLRDARVSRLMYEDFATTCAAYTALLAPLGLTLVPIGEAIQTLRAVKDAEEIECIRRAQAITDAAYTHILSVLTPTMTEVDVVLELEFFMRRHGADGVAFPSIAVSGASSALPHGLPSRRPLSRGFLTMDFGALVNGYASDMTRTVSLGKATAEMKHIYATVLEAQHLGIEAIAAGVPGKLVDAAARTHINAAGYRGLFGHSFGHGVGLEIHEMPRLSARSDLPLAVGNVVTAEPGIYREGSCGCRIEDMGVVTEEGFWDLTASSKELIELF